MLPVHVRWRDFQCRKIHSIDEILRWQLEKADPIRSAVPMKVNSAAALCIEPLVQSLSEGRPISLMHLRKPDENVGFGEQPAQRFKSAFAGRVRFFCQDHARNMRAGSTNDVLKRGYQGCEDARIEFEQN